MSELARDAFGFFVGHPKTKEHREQARSTQKSPPKPRLWSPDDRRNPKRAHAMAKALAFAASPRHIHTIV
jgi:hypothetical protein